MEFLHVGNIVKQDLGLDCKIHISVRKKESTAIREKFEAIYKVEIKEVED